MNVNGVTVLYAIKLRHTDDIATCYFDAAKAKLYWEGSTASTRWFVIVGGGRGRILGGIGNSMIYYIHKNKLQNRTRYFTSYINLFIERLYK